jgi:DNA mismatch repair ATPase MutL
VGATERLALQMHRDVFEFNGFKVEQQGEEFYLRSLPMSKSTTFTEKDFYELV